jgi:tetrahydromethanopterin S-methyltransferase subunit C
MDQNLTTGNPKIDFVLLGIGWVCAFISMATLPVILSSLASLLVIVNQVIIYRNRKKTNK